MRTEKEISDELARLYKDRRRWKINTDVVSQELVSALGQHIRRLEWVLELDEESKSRLTSKQQEPIVR